MPNKRARIGDATVPAVAPPPPTDDVMHNFGVAVDPRRQPVPVAPVLEGRHVTVLRGILGDVSEAELKVYAALFETCCTLPPGELVRFNPENF